MKRPNEASAWRHRDCAKRSVCIAFVGALVVGILCSKASTAVAANGTWNVDAAGNWVDAGNWLSEVVPGTSGTAFTSTDIATFSTTLTANRTVTLDANRNVKDILFSNGSGFGYTLSSGTLRLTNGGSVESAATNGDHVDEIASAFALPSGTASLVSNATGSGVLVLSGPVSGSGRTLRLAGTNTGTNTVSGAVGGGVRIVKDGAGYWALTVAPATDGGGFTVNSGTLDVKATLGNNFGGLALTGGVMKTQNLNITSNRIAGTTISGGLLDVTGSANISSTTLTSGTIRSGGNMAFTNGAAVALNGGKVEVGSNLAFNHSITTGTARLNGAAVSVAGGITTLPSAFLAIQNDSSVSLGSLQLGTRNATANVLVGDASVLTTGSIGAEIQGVGFADLNNFYTSNVQFTQANASYTFTTRLTGKLGYFAGVSNANLVGSGPVGIVQASSGKTVLSASNSFTGSVWVTSGTLAMGHANSLGATSNFLSVQAGTLDLSGYNVTVGRLSGTSISGVITSSTTGVSTLTVSSTFNTSYAGRITDGLGTIALVKSGNGGLTLSGSNSFTGATTVSGGTLTIGHNLALQNSRINTDDNGSLGLDSGITTPTFGGLSGSTALATKLTGFANVTALTLNPLSGSVTYSGIIADGTGPLAVTKSGAGEQIVSGLNTYTGATLVSAGRLQVSSGNINSSSAVTINGPSAELKYNSATALTSPITFSQGMLSGTGTINSAVTAVGLAATLSPGNSPGIMPFGTSQAWESFTYLWETNNFLGTTAGTDFDQITIAGSLSLTGSTGSYLLDITSLTAGNLAGNVGNFSDEDRSWTILTTTGGITGFDAANWTISAFNFTSSPAATGSWSLNKVNNDLVLSYVVVVPEPDTIVFAGIGIAMAGWSLWKRRRINKILQK